MIQSTANTLLLVVLMAACIPLADANRSGNLRRKRITFEVPDEARKSLSRTEFMLLNDEQELEDLWTRAMKATDEKEAKILEDRFLQLKSMSMPSPPVSKPTTATPAPAAPSAGTTAPAATSAPTTGTTAPAVVTSAPAVGTTAPAVGTTAPATATTAPGVVTSAPAVATTAPVVGTTAPAAATTSPAVVTSAPVVGTTAPAGGTTAPAGDCLGGTTRDDYILKQLSAVTDPTLLENPASPQGMAIDWITLDDPLKVDPCVYPTLEQRYGLATIYFATAGASWTTKTDWLGGTSECQWFGITCDDTNVTVHKVQLRKSLGAFQKRLSVSVLPSNLHFSHCSHEQPQRNHPRRSVYS